MIVVIVDRGPNVQRGNVLRELTAAYAHYYELEMLSDEFENIALLAENSFN